MTTWLKKVRRKNEKLKNYNDHEKFDKSDHMGEFKDW